MKPNRTHGKAAVIPWALIVLLMALPALLAESSAMIEVGRFSAEKTSDSLPRRWELFDFKNIKRHTDYRLVKADGQVVVKAEAEASASALTRKMPIDPKEYPIVQWRWKVTNVLKKGNAYRKEGDDYPARVYIAFKYDPDRLNFSERIKYEVARIHYGEYRPLATINYVWASSEPVGLIVPNAYTDRAMMVVVESGIKHLNTWVSEKRNIYTDYRKAFKDEPPMIFGVAIMTDTDNTGESATTYYLTLRHT